MDERWRFQKQGPYAYVVRLPFLITRDLRRVRSLFRLLDLLRRRILSLTSEVLALRLQLCFFQFDEHFSCVVASLSTVVRN